MSMVWCALSLYTNSDFSTIFVFLSLLCRCCSRYRLHHCRRCCRSSPPSSSSSLWLLLLLLWQNKIWRRHCNEMFRYCSPLFSVSEPNSSRYLWTFQIIAIFSTNLNLVLSKNNIWRLEFQRKVFLIWFWKTHKNLPFDTKQHRTTKQSTKRKKWTKSERVFSKMRLILSA